MITRKAYDTSEYGGIGQEREAAYKRDMDLYIISDDDDTL